MAKWSPIWDRKDLPLKRRKELIQEARLTPPSRQKASKSRKYPHLQRSSTGKEF